MQTYGDLGPELFRCRPRTLADYAAGPLSAFLLSGLRLLIYLIIAMSAAALVVILLGLPDKQMNTIILAVLTLLGTVGQWWFIAQSTANDFFAIHENGLAYQLTPFNSGVLRFEELEEVHFGRDPTSLEKLVTFTKQQASAFATVQQTALTLVLTNGRRITFERGLALFHREDLQQLFDMLASKCPGCRLPPVQFKEADVKKPIRELAWFVLLLIFMILLPFVFLVFQ